MKNKSFFKRFTIAIFLFKFSPIAFSTDTLHQGENLQKLVSSNGVFELGFFNTSSSTKSFAGIWFTDTPDIVVWVANRDHPLNGSSIALTVDDNGSLLLYDAYNQKITWPPTGINYGKGAVTLQLQNSGNLILNDLTTNTVIWQSFDYPTNTLLPGMKLGKNLITGFETYLSSWKSADDPSTGQYSYRMDTKGAPEIIMWDGDQIHYRSGMWNGLYFSGEPIMTTYTDRFTFLFVWNQSAVSYGYMVNPNSHFSLVVLNETGVKERLVLDQSHHTWNNGLLKAPYGNCDNYRTCGPFGVCQPDGLTACNCLPGFEPAEPTEWNMGNISGGCTRMKPLGCSSKSDEFYEFKEVKLPYSHDATVDANISVKECKHRCLMDCSCLAYAPFDISKESGCVMWNSQLIDMKYVKDGQALYVKILKSEQGTSKRIIIAAAVSGSIISVFLLSSFGYLFWRKKMRYPKQDETGIIYLAQSKSIKGTDVPVFDMETIFQATENFSNKLGEGGFGIVYKGRLTSGQDIAVKRLSRSSSERLNEFMNEVLLIAKLQHRNLVRLIGCCVDNNERMLIYEFMTNKSLDHFIFDATIRASLNWKMRLEIVSGIARGLLYLHQDSRFNIIHRDLKAANILLDEEMNPKISDFGTARLFRREQGEIRTEIVIGTRGYMSPEYAMEGKISVKSDVYSFGVLLLEIISGKRNQGNQNLLAYAWRLWEEGNVLKLLDEALEMPDIETELVRCVHVGFLCVQECPDDRPSMSFVLTMLSSDDMVLQDPKKPFVGASIRGFTSDWPSYEYDSSVVDELTITSIEGR